MNQAPRSCLGQVERRCPGAPFERRWDKEMSGGQEERKVPGRDRRTGRGKGVSERGDIRRSLSRPRRAFPCAVGASARGRRKVGRTRGQGPQTPSVPLRPGPGRGGPQRSRRRVPLTCWPVAGGCAGPPYAPPAPELGPGSPKSRNMPWAGCSVGSASAARILTHSLLTESFLFMNEILGLNHFDWGWGALREARVTSELRLSDALSFASPPRTFRHLLQSGSRLNVGKEEDLVSPSHRGGSAPSDVAAHTWCNFLAAPR